MTSEDLEIWKRNPLELVLGLGFINTSEDNTCEEKGSVYFVRDLISSARGARHFEVLFEDIGEEVFSFGEDIFDFIATSAYVRVEDAPN